MIEETISAHETDPITASLTDRSVNNLVDEPQEPTLSEESDLIKTNEDE